MTKYNINHSFKEIVVVPVFEGKGLGLEAKKLNKELSGLLEKMYKDSGFEAKKLQMSFSLTNHDKIKAVLMVGLGEFSKLGVRDWKQVLGASVITLQSKKYSSFNVVVERELIKKLGTKKFGVATAIAVETAGYAFDEHKSEKDARVVVIKEVDLALTPFSSDKNNIQKGINEGVIIGNSVNYTRHLGNIPPSIMTPTLLAQEAEKLAKDPTSPRLRGTGKLKVKILSRPEMKKLGMGCLLGVSQGSIEEPKFIILEYMAGGKTQKPTVLAGKGITFDSGGLGIKPGNYMNDMKFDMLGAATVLGAIKAVAGLKLKKNIIGLIPSCENMPSGSSYRPDDILTAMNGKTVEIIHTDAEGRLILADALAYASNYKPKEVIDFATLTGACMVALGNERSGLFATDDKIIEKLKKSSEEVGEQLWHLPIGEEYSEAIKSEVADIKNLGGVGTPSFGGASTAAAFLQFFTDYPWAHIDLSCSYYSGKGKPWIRVGANGFGVETMVEYLR